MNPVELNNISEIPVELVDKVKLSVSTTFESLSGMQPDLVEENGQDGPMDGIIGNIAVFNADHTLSLMIAVPKETALALSEAFCGMPLPFDSEDMGDLVGEVSNILAGEVAANIEQIGFVGQSSLPMVTRGSNMTLFMPKKPATAKLKFNGLGGLFWINLALSESSRRT